MTTSSAPTNSFEWSSNSTSTGFIALDIGAIGSDTITLTTGTDNTYYYTGGGIGGANGSTVTINGGGTGYTIGSGISSSGTVSISNISGAGTGFSWSVPQEWDGCFPDYERIQKMCEEYPALKIAFEKFKTTYKLVKDHYDTPEDKRPKP